MTVETVTIQRRPGWSFMGELKVEIECDPATLWPIKLGLAVRALFKSDADLRGAVLSGAVLSDAVLRGAVLSGAVLSGAVLRGADLSDAVLRGADLSGAVLRGAVLSGADLSDAVLRGAVLSDAVLRGADLSGAVLRDADLSDAVLRGAVLSGAVLSGAVLRGAVLRGAVLRGADLSDADLPPALAAMRPKDDAEAATRLVAVAEAALAPQALDMGDWHRCETTHCIAGWAVHLQGNAGYLLEEMVGPHAAGAIILGDEAAKHFYDGTDAAREWLTSVREAGTGAAPAADVAQGKPSAEGSQP